MTLIHTAARAYGQRPSTFLDVSDPIAAINFDLACFSIGIASEIEAAQNPSDSASAFGNTSAFAPGQNVKTHRVSASDAIGMINRKRE